MASAPPDSHDHAELAVLRRIAARDTSGLLGDDAAILDAPTGRLVVTADVAETGVHLHATLTPWQAGYRAAACSLSDLAAMGALPVALTCTISASPAGLDQADLVAAGVAARARECGAQLVGGDISALGADTGIDDRAHWVVSVTCIGTTAGGNPSTDLEPLRLAGARAGDELFVTGALGSGLAAVQRRQSTHGNDHADAHDGIRIDRHIVPPDRTSGARALIGLATACTDISDGLAAEVLAMATACNCGAVIDLSDVPLHTEDLPWLGGDPALAAIGASDDYELLVALPAGSRELVADMQQNVKFAIRLMYVGRLADGEVVFERNGQAIPAPRGYEHGRMHPDT